MDGFPLNLDGQSEASRDAVGVRGREPLEGLPGDPETALVPQDGLRWGLDGERTALPGEVPALTCYNVMYSTVSV